jgi:hypothetical protein
VNWNGLSYVRGYLVAPQALPDKELERFNSADGRSTLTIYALENADGDTPASYLRKNLRLPRSALDYERVTRSFFAISTEGQGTVLYSRCNFASRGTVHCIDLVYPQEVARAWDGIVTRISRSLRPLEGKAHWHASMSTRAPDRSFRH